MQNNRPQSPIPGTTASEADYPQATNSGARTTSSNLSDYGIVQTRRPLRDRWTEPGTVAFAEDAMGMDVDFPAGDGGVAAVLVEEQEYAGWQEDYDGKWAFVGQATIRSIHSNDESDDDAMGRDSAKSLPSNIYAPPAPLQKERDLPPSSRGGSVLSGLPWTPRTQTPGPSSVARRNVPGVAYDMGSSWFPGANPPPDLDQANATLEAHQNALAFDFRRPQPGSRNGHFETPPLTPLSLNSGIKTAFTAGRNGTSILSPLSLLRTPSRFTKAGSSVIDHHPVQPQYRPAQATHPRLMSLMNEEDDHRSTGSLTRERDQSPQSTNTRRATRRKLENEPLAATKQRQRQPSSSTSPTSTSLPSRKRSSQNGTAKSGVQGGLPLRSSSRLNTVLGYSDSVEDMYATASGASSSKVKGKQRKRAPPSSLVPTEPISNENEDPRHIRPSAVPTEIIDTEEKNPLSLGTPVALFKDLPPAGSGMHMPSGYEESVPRTSTPPHPSRRKKIKKTLGMDEPPEMMQSPPLGMGFAARSPIPPIQESPGEPIPPPEGPMKRSPNVSSPGPNSSSSFPESSLSRLSPATPPPITKKRPRSPKPEKVKGKGKERVSAPGYTQRQHSREAELLAVNSRLFEVASESVDVICSAFLRLGADRDVLPHVNACHRVKTGLEAVKTALRRRSEFSPDQMGLASDRWNSTHIERLGSLQRSLEKFNRLADSVAKLGDQKISGNSADKGHVKLLEFATKFLGLGSKFNSMFDRIELRRVHEQMAEAYDEAKMARYDIEEDLERWAEAKAKRAKLRYEFESLKSRTGRRAALIS